MTELGRSNLEIFQYPVWHEELEQDPDFRLTYELVEQFIDAQLGEENTSFDTIGIDTMDQFWKICEEKVLRSFNVDDLQKIPQGSGNGWHLTNKLMTRLLNKLYTSKLGMVMTSHVTEKPMESSIDGSKYEQVIPTMDRRAWEWVCEKVDFVFCLDYVGKDRLLVVRGNSRVRASVGPVGRFLDPNGEPISRIKLPDDADAGYEVLLAGFNNQLWDYDRLRAEEEAAKKQKAQAVLQKALGK